MPAPVNVTTGPPHQAWSERNYFDANDNLLYNAKAMSFQPNPVTLTVTSVSKAAAASIASTAHGLLSGNVVIIAGGTGDWAALNGEHIITVTGADTFTVAVNSGAFAGSFAGEITTHAPREGSPCWAIQRNVFDASNNLTSSGWAGGNTSPNKVAADRASLNYQ
jgi:hypothetical protein